MTDQETTIYEALQSGDHEAIEQLRTDANSAAQERNSETELTPAEQFQVDYMNAWNQYQADHEAPEEEREEATKVHIAEENELAEPEEV